MTQELKQNTQAMRVLPVVIEEVIGLGFDVIVNKNGYLLSGFYGCDPRASGLISNDNDKYVGYVLLVDSTQGDIMIGFDHKGKKHSIANMDDLIKLNHHIWKAFIKDSNYKQVNTRWFKFLYEKGMLEINPKK